MNIGIKIRALRKQRQLSMKDLAEKTECTPSFISQIERDLANPSINTLKRISEILKVPLIYFFEESENSGENYIIRKEERQKLNSPNEKSRAYLLTPHHFEKNIEMHMVVIEPGGISDKLYTNDSEEVGYVLKGELTLILDDSEYIVKEGDSIYIPIRLPHGWRNDNDSQVVTIWASSPPLINT